MEWMLQVLDEFDDACAAAGHWWVGARRSVGVVVLGLAATAIGIAALSVGAAPMLLAGGALTLSVGAAFSLYRRFAPFAH
jgi:hypothetical protein